MALGCSVLGLAACDGGSGTADEATALSNTDQTSAADSASASLGDAATSPTESGSTGAGPGAAGTATNTAAGSNTATNTAAPSDSPPATTDASTASGVPADSTAEPGASDPPGAGDSPDDATDPAAPSDGGAGGAGPLEDAPGAGGAASGEQTGGMGGQGPQETNTDDTNTDDTNTDDTNSDEPADDMLGEEDECPGAGDVHYTFNDLAAWPQDALDKITPALDEAISHYNCYSNLSHSLTINYKPGVPTAEANVDGWISFGTDRNYMVVATVMHEIGHTMGVGFYPWAELLSDGRWTGSHVNELMASIPVEERDSDGGMRDYITADGQHFWPYGLNYASEHESEWSLINHVRVVDAMNRDKADYLAR